MYSVHGPHAHIAYMSLDKYAPTKSSRLPVQYRPGNLDAHLSGSNSNNIFFSSAVPWNKLNGVLRSAITSLGYNYQRVCYDRLQKLDNSFNAMSLLTAKFAIMKQEIMRDVGSASSDFSTE